MPEGQPRYSGDVYESIWRALQLAGGARDARQIELNARLLGFYEGLIQDGLIDYKMAGTMEIYRAPEEYAYMDDRIQHYAERSLVVIGGAEHKLAPIPNALLLILTNPPNRTVSYHHFFSKIWPDSPYISLQDNLRVQMGRVRSIIEPNSEDPQYLKTVNSIGYFYISVGEWSTRGVPPDVRRPAWPERARPQLISPVRRISGPTSNGN